MKKLLLLVALMSFSISAYATHAYGGEITWKCFSTGPNAGKFKFYMTLYRDCGSGTATLPSSVAINSNSPAGTISLSQVGTNTDVSFRASVGAEEDCFRELFPIKQKEKGAIPSLTESFFNGIGDTRVILALSETMDTAVLTSLRSSRSIMSFRFGAG